MNVHFVAPPPATVAATPLDAALRAEFDAIRAGYPVEATPSLVLPLLHCVQARQGWISEGDALMVAHYLGVPAIRVEEAASWYSMFRRAPAGRHVVQVCRNIACSLRGAESVIAHLEKRLGIRVGESTADGRFTLQTVECLASCGTAPAMQINDTYHEQLTPERVDAILAELK